MNINDLSPELREKARACGSTEELCELAKEEGMEIPDEQLEGVPETQTFRFMVPRAATTQFAAARGLLGLAALPASCRHGCHLPYRPAFRSWPTKANRPSNTANRLEGRHKVALARNPIP